MIGHKKKWDYHLSDILTHIYGIISVIAFLVALIFSVISLNKINGPSFPEVLWILTALIAILSSLIVIYSLKYSKLHTISTELIELERDNNSMYILIKQQAVTLHCITHYYRNLIFLLDEFNLNCTVKDGKKENDMIHVLERNENFLINVTTALQNFFSIYADDNCSITLKLLSADKQNVKTLFRDPVNLKKRRQSEPNYSDGYYSVVDNTAFNIIASDNYTDFYFASDNLKTLYENHQYQNINPNWFVLYNATVVVPISRVISRSERHILGFITVDNIKGGLAHDSVLEFLFSVADLLYNYLVKMNQFVTFAHSNNFKNEKTERYLFGRNS